MSFTFKKSRDLMLNKQISFKNLIKLVNCTSLDNRIINRWLKKIWKIWNKTKPIKWDRCNKWNRQNKRSKWNKSEIFYPI